MEDNVKDNRIANSEDIIARNFTAPLIQANCTTNDTTMEFSIPLFKQWVVMEVLTYALAVWTAYLIVSLVFHHKQRGAAIKNNQFMQQKRKRFQAFDWLTISAAVLAFLRLIFGLDTIWGRSSELNCTEMKMVRLLLGILCYWITYIILWYRQRILYNKPILASITNKFTRYLSLASIIMICLTFLYGGLVFISTGNYQATPNGCIFKDESRLATVKWLGIIVMSSIFMTMLLILFIFPVVKQRKCNSDHNITNSSANDGKMLVRRAMMATIVTIGTDVIANLLITFVKNGVDELSNFLTDLNVAVNLICTLYCFSDWRKRLFPWVVKPKKTQDVATESQKTATTIA